MKSVRKRLTYANVMSSIAVFLVVAGGTALAASQLGKNTVGPKQLKENAVTATKIKDGAVTAGKLSRGRRRRLQHQHRRFDGPERFPRDLRRHGE